MTENTRPPRTGGLRHIALYCRQLDACERFYVDLLGMQVEWRPDADNIYLSSGNDNLALHRAPANFSPAGDQHLDHIGFILRQQEDVDIWYDFLKEQGVRIKAQPRSHRDGARSFYCVDPDDNIVQLIFHPPIANQ